MSLRTRFWLKILTAFGFVISVLAWLVLSYVLVRPPSYKHSKTLGPVSLLSWPQHDEIYSKTDFPYVLELTSNQGALLYFGCRHTADASDPQLIELERRWKDFRPTVALCEGRERMNRFASRPDSGPYSESRLVRTLAYQSGTTLYTLEPEYQDEVDGLLSLHSPKEVATYLSLRAYTSEAKGYSGSREELMLTLLQKRTNVNGLRNTFDSIESFEAYWREEFSASVDWRDLPNTESNDRLLKIGHSSRQIRGEHMVQTLLELVAKGERVFAVVGASHVIRQGDFLRLSLQENRRD